MMTFSDLASVSPDPVAPFTDRLRLAVAAYLDPAGRRQARPGARRLVAWQHAVGRRQTWCLRHS
jgi:hypothetical protein